MLFGNLLYKSSLTSDEKYYHKHEQQAILKRPTRWTYMFCLTCGTALFIIYSLIQFRTPLDLLTISYCVNVCSTVLERKPNVSAVPTGPGIPLITVGLYYLPLNESNMARYRSLKEKAYGTRDTFGYPIGAQLLSNESEYTVPSDRFSNERRGHEYKYFNEMTGNYHMDARFGKSEQQRLSDVERRVILRGLFATWSNFTDEKQIPAWIAHGTLLGWWWGNSFLPWDSDIDVQMNANFLYVLARFNKTVLSDRYLIDVNPHFTVRHPQKYNYIDARLIDKHTGYFIDITGMADTGTTRRSDSQKLLLYDKHEYKTFYSDLHPLVRIEFEGTPTWRPYQTANCLIKEYGAKALVKTAYQQYNYNVINATWVRNKSLLASPLQIFHRHKNPHKLHTFELDLTRRVYNKRYSQVNKSL